MGYTAPSYLDLIKSKSFLAPTPKKSINYGAGVDNVINSSAPLSSLTNKNPISSVSSAGMTSGDARTGTTGTSSTGGSAGTAAAALANTYSDNSANNIQNQIAQEALNAYNANMAALESAYGTSTDALSKNYGSTTEQLINAYANAKNSVNQSADKSNQEAYLNRMLSERDLQQRLTAQGLSGGASESTIASLKNNYGNARNQIETGRNTNLTDVETSYNDTLSAAKQAYDTAVANANSEYQKYKISLNQDLNNQRASSYTDMYNNLASTGADYSNVNAALPVATYTSPAASNTTSNVSLTQQDTSTTNPAQTLKAAGRTNVQIINELDDRGYSVTQIAEFLKNL